MEKKNIIIISVCGLVLAGAGWRIFSSNLTGRSEEPAGVRVMNLDTGHRFHIEMDRDFPGWPVKAPDTGTMTGYPVEVCKWNQCANLEGGTWVILNETLGKPGPTHCPVCGHVVVAHNPLPPEPEETNSNSSG